MKVLRAINMNKRFIYFLGFILASSLLILAQGAGIPDTLRVKTDFNNSLLVTAVAQVLPLSQPTQFSNTRLATDASNNLIVALAGVTAGASTTTFKAGGMLCNTSAADCSTIAYVDAGVINQWNVMSLTLPASSLTNNGDSVKVRIIGQLATNANTKAYQLYWGGGTCSGTGATCCSTGTQIFSDGSTGSNVTTISDYLATRVSSGNQQINGITYTGATSISSVDNVATTATDTAIIPIVYCARNTSAGAATLSGVPNMRIDYTGK